jgi:hypothetical protein
MTFLRKEEKNLSPNGENWSMEKLMVKIGPYAWRSFRIFVCKSEFLPFLPFLVLFLPFFGLDTESVSNISDTIVLHF